MPGANDRIDRELRVLKLYAVLMTLFSATLFGVIFKMIQSPSFEEVNAERINIVEKDGKIRLVISNKSRQHPGMMDGIVFNERKGQRPPGLMFFGENGNEVGGLVFDNSEEWGQGGSLTFDKFRGDQTIQVLHEEGKDGSYFAGIKMSDQNTPLTELLRKQKEILELPTKTSQVAALQEMRERGQLMTERLRIGKTHDKSSIIELKDAKGRVRIELKVEASGKSKINFLDDSGGVFYSLPKEKSKHL